MNVTNSCRVSEEPCPENRTGLLAYACFYFDIHGYVCLAICCFGIPTNILNIIVLTKKKLRSPINTILTGIAVSDLITMMCYMPYVIHFNIMYGPERTSQKYTEGWTWFLAVHTGLTITAHTISVWLGVIMAIVRVILVNSIGRGSSVFTVRVAITAVVCVYVLSIATYFPNYLFTKVSRIDCIENSTTYHFYRIRNMRLGAADETTLEAVAAWNFIIIGKILPCILITVFGGLLLLSLNRSKKRTISLRSGQVDNRLKQHKRTTWMLLAIILMFILTELPASILVLIGLSVESFFGTEYMLLADTLDVIALINNAINFILYCAMSKQFRDCLCDVACKYIEEKSRKMYHGIRSKAVNSIVHQNNEKTEKAAL